MTALALSTATSCSNTASSRTRALSNQTRALSNQPGSPQLLLLWLVTVLLPQLLQQGEVPCVDEVDLQ